MLSTACTKKLGNGIGRRYSGTSIRLRITQWSTLPSKYRFIMHPSSSYVLCPVFQTGRAFVGSVRALEVYCPLLTPGASDKHSIFCSVSLHLTIVTLQFASLVLPSSPASAAASRHEALTHDPFESPCLDWYLFLHYHRSQSSPLEDLDCLPNPARKKYLASCTHIS